MIPVKALTASIGPEADLLLCCARTTVDAATTAHIEALVRETLDWERLLRMAQQHGMMPLLSRHLRDVCPDSVPKAIFLQLRYYYHTNSRRTLFLTEEVLKLLSILDSHGIPAIPYKGPTLAAFAYGDLALRQSGDLDILVRKRDVLKAKDLLIAQGYLPASSMTPAQEAVYLQTECEYNFSRPDGNMAVEIHWRFVPWYFSFPLRVESFWRRLSTASLGDRQVRALRAEDLLLCLCVHGTKHIWNQLNWICDIAELVRTHPQLDWECVVQQARKAGSRRLLFLGLTLAHDLLGAPLPTEVLQQMRADSGAGVLAAQVRQCLFAKDSSDINYVIFHLQARERWQDQVRYCRRLLMGKQQGRKVGLAPPYLTRSDWALVPAAGLFRLRHHQPFGSLLRFFQK